MDGAFAKASRALPTLTRKRPRRGRREADQLLNSSRKATGKLVCQKAFESVHSRTRTEPSSHEPVTEPFQGGRIGFEDFSVLPDASSGDLLRGCAMHREAMRLIALNSCRAMRDRAGVRVKL